MAENVEIKIKDEASARKWLEQIVGINEDYHNAMKDAGSTLEDMQNFAEGTMVDDFVDLGSTILRAADATFDAINKIGETVSTFLGAVGGFVEEAKGVIAGVAKLFGI